MTELTAKQSQVLRFLTNQSRQGRSPTIREISQHFGIASPNGVWNHLLALEKKGKIRLSRDGKSRGIHIVGQTRHRTDIERQLYDALQAMLTMWTEMEQGIAPYPGEKKRVLDQVYDAINEADDQ